MKKGVDSSIDFQPQNRGHYDRGRNPLHSLYKLFGKERLEQRLKSFIDNY